MTMPPERWERIQELFHQALEQSPDGRAAWLADVCGGDEAMQREVESLLASDADAHGFIAGAIGDVASAAVQGATPAGKMIGPYRVVSELGRGGMGTVYLAERADDEYAARVAVKVVRGGLLLDTAASRFRSERQILADLDHPNIARLLDGGTTDDGLPYLVMEYVDGETIDHYCDHHNLSPARRIELFREVCQAVEHAHRHLIVHRDLKPGNILVTADGTPKLLDFGIAKLLDPSSMPHTVAPTDSALRLMTPAYASPEQVRGGPITVATDVYALGVVLYELLCGHLPYEIDGAAGPAEIERVVCEAIPERPSIRVSRDRDPTERTEGSGSITAEELGRRRGGTVAQVRRRLAGDLDRIVLMALRKEPERRYPSVDQFSADLDRHLQGLPVLAQPDTWGYRAERFVRRHPVGVAAVVGFLLLSTAFAGVMAVQASRLARERDVAEVQRQAAEQVSNYLVDVFGSSDPNESMGDTVTARELLDRGTERLPDLDDQPAVQSALMDVIGRAYQNLGDYEQAAPFIDSALAMRERLYGTDNLELAATLVSAADLAYELGDYDTARDRYRASLDIRRRLLGEDADLVVETWVGLADALVDLNETEAAEEAYRGALAAATVRHGLKHELVATALVNLSGLVRGAGRLDEADSLGTLGLALRRELFGNDHLDVAHALNQLASTKRLKGETEAALAVAQEGLAIRRRVYGGDHVEIAASLGNVAGLLGMTGDVDGAVEARREMLAMLRRILGNDHPYIAAGTSSLGSALFAAGDLSEAEAVLRESVRISRLVLPARHPNLAYPLNTLGQVLMKEGRYREAEAALREGWEVRRDGLPAGHWHVAASAGTLGECLAGMARREEAEPLLLDSYAVLRDTFGDEDRRTGVARDRLVALYEGWGRPDKAAEYAGAMDRPRR